MEDSLNGDEKDFIGPKLKAVWNQVSRPFTSCPDPVVYDDLDEYDFSYPSRGVAVIINNVTFENKSPREGADVDGSNLTQVFSQFGFTDIRYHQDLTAARITDVFYKISKENYKKADCFVCAVSSHGDEYFFDPDENNRKRREEFILGTDYRPVLTRNILEMFNDKNCPTLKGKPRIFFIQVCF
ncbi:caspase-3-like [Gigantopelta aegis]|uniref:caspase-3-like n=1 Tax=Gigantopelta aegis TaxID=1735272 RepID=UPI001B88B89B|nr:caspase-3-like [Gigantopelta aegis]